MHILIISDTHRRDGNVEYLHEQVGRPDLLLHLGDVEGRQDYIEALFDCPCRFVAGNNDFFMDLPEELVLSAAGHRILMTHGHMYNAYRGTKRLKEAARRNRADIVLFGHTHMPVIDDDDDVTAVNPGSLAYPRQANRLPSYAVLELSEGKEPIFQICFLEEKEGVF